MPAPNYLDAIDAAAAWRRPAARADRVADYLRRIVPWW
jgi:hypothetical protein